MKNLSGQIRLAATDLSNHLACRHLTSLDLSVAHGRRNAPEWRSSDLVVIQELGLRHEAKYLEFLQAKSLPLADLRGLKDEQAALTETLSCMQRGVEVIAQGSLAAGRWFGRPDVLMKVAKPSRRLGEWSYEAYDCKLARETKAETILQLALYSALLEEHQGEPPEFMYVVPGQSFEAEQYRFAEYVAYYRHIKARLENICAEGSAEETYPEPCAHCDVCRWFPECDTKRRGDDHLSLVAGIRRQQRNQLEEWNTETMAKLAVLQIPLTQRPKHGSREGIERVREQARVQVAGRTTKKLVCEPLLPVTEGMGFCRLPEPSTDDVFVDFEGDPFVGESGLQYLFGFAFRNAEGQLAYEKRWALNREEEKKGFEWLVDEIMRRRKANPQMHVYHYGAYEPGALKRLMGMYATREDEIDRMLRAGVLVDLHQAFKQGVRASVEEYSLKRIEAFYRFERRIPPDVSRPAMSYVEHRLELDWGDEELPEKYREAMEGYNRDDCFSTGALQRWLEEERRKLVEAGTDVPRFVDRGEEASEELDERQKRVATLVQELTAGIPPDLKARTDEQQGQWLLAQLLDWHRRDAKPKAWRYFDLRGMDDANLLDEKDALSGLVWMGTVTSASGVTADRYSFPNQETSVRPDEKKEVHHKSQRIGTVVGMDPIARTIDIEKFGDASSFHPTSIFVKEPYRNPRAQQDSLYRLGCWVRDHGIAAAGPWQAARSFLLRRPPELLDSESLRVSDTEEFSDELTRIVSALSSSILAVQGPPGSGKTTSAARAIDALVTKRKMKIGVTALSHPVIRNLLKTIGIEGSGRVRCMHKSDKKYDGSSEGIQVTTSNAVALKAVRQGSVDVLGGTAFLWSREEFADSVDVLFVDEASQVSLADVTAISQGAKSVVLIGDPQQLARPGEASHPPGAELSGLEHILKDPDGDVLKTMPASLGLFIDHTRRLHPKICDFTSEAFYEGRLLPHFMTRSRVIKGHPWLAGAGLWFVPVEHEGNRNSSAEEVEVVARIVESLLMPEVKWFRGVGRSGPLRPKDILIVAPYNAQVSDLGARLPGISAGTVDKFQGQEAAVVIYSMTTSSPEEAPRGMEFLYSLNRFNVATSRGMSNVILVGNPRLFEPECRTPRQMQLANAMCRYLELATSIDEADL
ncbi:MAG TPA: TM0106 family RecB-like putative nuclease [Candidatus Acidoferrales bacterium]|nr:TM0106 family RecB-like putative nuclease [Candidatus Acidoferrales bacterium]